MLTLVEGRQLGHKEGKFLDNIDTDKVFLGDVRLAMRAGKDDVEYGTDAAQS